MILQNPWNMFIGCYSSETKNYWTVTWLIVAGLQNSVNLTHILRVYVKPLIGIILVGDGFPHTVHVFLDEGHRITIKYPK